MHGCCSWQGCRALSVRVWLCICTCERLNIGKFSAYYGVAYTRPHTCAYTNFIFAKINPCPHAVHASNASGTCSPLDLIKPRSAMTGQVKRIEEEEWSYIPVGGPLPSIRQPITAFGAAANLVHPATGYSIVRSLREAPGLAKAIAGVLKTEGESRDVQATGHAVWDALWPLEKQRQVGCLSCVKSFDCMCVGEECGGLGMLLVVLDCCRSSQRALHGRWSTHHLSIQVGPPACNGPFVLLWRMKHNSA